MYHSAIRVDCFQIFHSQAELVLKEPKKSWIGFVGGGKNALFSHLTGPTSHQWELGKLDGEEGKSS